MRILHIIKSLGRGGAETLLPATLKLHDQQEFSFHYLYFLPWKDQMVAEIERAGGTVTCLPASNNLALLGKVKEIARYCREHQIDLIHAHLPWAGFVARRVHRLTGIPLVYTEHNMQSRYHPATKWINRLTFNRQSLALAVSDDVKSSIEEHIRPKIPVRTLLNGVNTAEFTRSGPASEAAIRAELGIAPEALVVGTVAVFRSQKRLDVWLEVFEQIRREHSHTARGDAVAIIVGAGPLEEELSKRCSELELDDAVHFVGLQTEVRPYFEAMDVFMMTSAFEGLPIALLEAMSMQCAVVATDAGGIKQVVRHETDGLLVGVDEPERLTPLVVELADDLQRLAELKTAARERVVEAFSLRKMVDELEGVYAELVGK